MNLPAEEIEKLKKTHDAEKAQNEKASREAWNEKMKRRREEGAEVARQQALAPPPPPEIVGKEITICKSVPHFLLAIVHPETETAMRYIVRSLGDLHPAVFPVVHGNQFEALSAAWGSFSQRVQSLMKIPGLR